MRARISSQRFIVVTERLRELSPLGNFDVQASLRDRAIPGDFPQLFPQVWKTLGRDQTRMCLERIVRVGLKDADCNTNHFD